MTIKKWFSSISAIFLIWIAIQIAMPLSICAIVNVSTGNMSQQRFVIDKARNGLVFRSLGTRSLLGVGCSPNYELDVSGSAKIIRPLLVNIISASPVSIDWSKGAVQSITLANGNFGVTFSGGPVTAAYTRVGDTWVANLTLLVYVNANAAGTISSWSTAAGSTIKWSNGVAPPFAKSTTAEVYPIFFHAYKNKGTTSGVIYYGSY